MQFLTNQIKSSADMKSFVDNLVLNDKLFHFEDEPSEVIDRSDEPIFTALECELVNKRIDEICELNLLESAFNYALTEYLND